MRIGFHAKKDGAAPKTILIDALIAPNHNGAFLLDQLRVIRNYVISQFHNYVISQFRNYAKTLFRILVHLPYFDPFSYCNIALPHYDMATAIKMLSLRKCFWEQETGSSLPKPNAASVEIVAHKVEKEK